MAGVNIGNSAPGLGRLAAAIGGGPMGGYRQGYEGELKLQSGLAQALAQQEASRASARLHNLQADAEEAQVKARNPQAVLSSALTANGIPTDEGSAITHFLQTGKLGGKYSAGPTDMGPVAPAPEWQDKLGPVARSLGTISQALALGDKSVENVAKAEGMRREQGLSDGVLAGTVDPTRFAQSQYAAKGSAPYSFHEYGTGNNLTGKVDDSTGPAQRFGAYRNAETGNQNAAAGAHKASAASSYASADNSRAHAAESRQRTEQGARGGDIIPVTQADGSVLLVNKVTGLSRQAVGMDGKPVAKATAADKPLPEGAQKQLTGARNVQEAARDYMAKLQNWSKTDMLSPTQRATMGSAYNNLMLQAKEAYNLGVLNGPDYDILQSVVADPTKLKSALIPTDALTKQAQELQRIAGNIEAQVLRSHGKPAPASVPIPAAAAAKGAPKKITSDADYNALPSGAEFIAPDGSHRRKP